MFVVSKVKVHTITSGITFGADEVLLRQLSKKLQLTQTNHVENHVTILFCPISSRVGSDVEAAIHLVSGNKNVILVLMHHTRDGNYSTAGTKWSDVYPNVILDVHVLFHESVSGLLKCSKNTDAINQIQEVLNKYSENSWDGNIWMNCCQLALTCSFVLSLVLLVDWLYLLVLLIIMLVVVLGNYNNSSWQNISFISKFCCLIGMMVLVTSLVYRWRYHSVTDNN